MTYCVARDLFICFPPGFHFCFYVSLAVIPLLVNVLFLLGEFSVVQFGMTPRKNCLTRLHAEQSDSSAQANVTNTRIESKREFVVFVHL